MKINFLKVVFFVLCSINVIVAQNKIDKINLTYGEEITDDKGKIVKIIGEANSKIYTLVLKGKSDYFLKIFDSKAMKQIANNQIVLPEIKEKDVEFEEAVLINDKLYFIGSVYHRKEKSLR